MDTRLNSLDPRMKAKAIELLARCVEEGIMVKIINTFRTPAEQSAARVNGRSWVTRSKHQDGLAIDICPYEAWQQHGPNKLDWDANDPIWQRIGTIGEELGLTWGGRWKQRDMGHFELPS